MLSSFGDIVIQNSAHIGVFLSHLLQSMDKCSLVANNSTYLPRRVSFSLSGSFAQSNVVGIPPSSLRVKDCSSIWLWMNTESIKNMLSPSPQEVRMFIFSSMVVLPSNFVGWSFYLHTIVSPPTLHPPKKFSSSIFHPGKKYSLFLNTCRNKS